MPGFLTPFLFVTACGALLTEATLAREGEGHIKVTCLRGYESIRLVTKASAWQTAVREVNLSVSQGAGALTWRPDTTVHLTFANGGWVEFTPDMVSITNNMLPPLTGMRFAPDTDDDSAKCEAAE
jgi:hypothetical protein